MALYEKRFNDITMAGAELRHSGIVGIMKTTDDGH
jgi:hypothetical protein